MKTLLLVLSIVCARPVLAWEPVTHAGLTERAALAGSLHRRLGERLGRALGLYEPLTLHRGTLEDRELLRRLSLIDPEGGYAPDEGKQTALGWLTAGAVGEGVPAARNRHHFYDPSDGAGLHDEHDLALRTRISDVGGGIGSLRGVFTGATFDGTGMAAPAWLLAPDNEWGLQRYLDERARAASARLPSEREDALVRALVAAGAILHVLEDAGDPAHVRNDYRIALERRGGELEHFAAAQYGRMALPEQAGDPVVRARLGELFHDAAGGGLADRTQRRFFSPGSLPSHSYYAHPVAVPGTQPTGYAAGDAVPHLVAYRHLGDRKVEWFLDERCQRDYAEALLPETARYAAGAIELLFRGHLEIGRGQAGLTITNRELALGRGELSIYTDDGAGQRTQLSTKTIAGAAEGDHLAELPRPPGARRVTALYRGVDAAGEPLVIVEDVSLQ